MGVLPRYRLRYSLLQVCRKNALHILKIGPVFECISVAVKAMVRLLVTFILMNRPLVVV